MRHTQTMHARSALFDLYGDHLRERGGRAPVSALVRILAPLDISAASCRTAVSRMVRQGWLAPVRLTAGPGYDLTPRARRRLDDSAARIYRTAPPRWSGGWDMLVLDPVPQRAGRDRVRSGLGFLGYAPLSESTWLSPTRSAEVEPLLALEGVTHARFHALDEDPATRASTAWDLDGLAASYRGWLQQAAEITAGESDDPSVEAYDERAFAVRSVLVHEWRKFLFSDPGLPAELLPPDWVGHEAARVFAGHATRLQPAAARFVETALALDVTTSPTQTTGAPR